MGSGGRFATIRSLFRPSVQLQVVSDLHLEAGRHYSDFNIPRSAPYLVLAGDIGRLLDYDDYLGFLRRHCARFEHVYLVLGNHEFYGRSREEGLEAAASLEAEPELHLKLTVMNRTRVDINSRVILLGCTLQSHIPSESYSAVEKRVNDFRQINNWTIDHHNAEHTLDIGWLRAQVQTIFHENPHRRIVIVTHHAPSLRNTCKPPQEENSWSSAFCTNILESEIDSWLGSGCVRYWIFGHTHWCSEFRRGNMTVISNQRGYVLSRRDITTNLWKLFEKEGGFDIKKRIIVY
jgi:Calcineurin-like phosphoesterase